MSLLKSEKFCAAFAFNPSGNRLAAASVAGAMDDDFSSDAFLKIFDSSLTNFDSTAMPTLAKISIPDRVHRLDWSSHGSDEGMIAAGLTDGTVCLWSASALLSGDTESAMLYESKLHQQAVRGCQFNPLQPHFLATGGADKELCIWSFQDPKNPVKVPSISTTTQAAEVNDLRWNPRYAHILAVALSNGGVVVWDLKSKRPASTFNVSSNATIPCSALTWHPDVATQLVVARDDPSPVIQLWDLRKATAPFREIAVHSGGVLSMSWSPFDANVLVSCGRDGRTIFVNPNTGAVLGELPKQDNWVFDVKWAPRTPAVVASASYDSQLSLHATQSACAGAEAPKWLARPAPAVFAYGGRIAQAASNVVKVVASTSAEAESSVTKVESDFQAALAAAPTGSPARADFIESLKPEGLGSVAAAARCSVVGNKAPLLAHLGVAPEEVSADADNVTMPFAGSERDVERLVARCVVAGKLSDAVGVCIKANRFDDAFAIAQMSGKEEVSRVYEAYMERRAPSLRFVKYLEAIAHGRFAELATEASSAAVPWAEVLALYSTVVRPQEYSVVCSALGGAMVDASNLDAAFTCFVAGGDVDRAAATLVQKKDRKQHELVQAVTALEHTVQRQARCKEYAEVLAGHANSLAFEGNFAAAMAYASRAASLGVHEAAVVADRVRFLVPRERRLNVAAPFPIVREAPDPYTPECAMLAGKQVPSRAATVAPHYQAATTSSSQHHAAPVHHAAPAPTTASATRVTPQVPHPTFTAAPTHVAPVHPAPVAPVHPAPVAPVHPAPAAPVHPAPVHAAPVQPMSVPVQPLPVQPTRHADPVAQPTRTTAATHSSGSTLCSAVDVSAVAPENQAIISSITAAVSAVTEKRRRDSVDKAAVELFRQLAANAVQPSVVALLRDFTAALGTAESKAAWKALNDNHFDDVKPYLNIKFL